MTTFGIVDGDVILTNSTGQLYVFYKRADANKQFVEALGKFPNARIIELKVWKA